MYRTSCQGQSWQSQGEVPATDELSVRVMWTYQTAAYIPRETRQLPSTPQVTILPPSTYRGLRERKVSSSWVSAACQERKSIWRYTLSSWLSTSYKTMQKDAKSNNTRYRQFVTDHRYTSLFSRAFIPITIIQYVNSLYVLYVTV